MDTRGLVFALAGTEAMFPALTDVFSPVPRQFVRINVGNFERPEDTRRAVVRRLLSEGYTWALPEPSVTGDIHRITRGNPYEIVLVSHFAFRQATEEQSQKPLQLTRGVLEHVAGQLVQQNPALQTLIDKVNTLSHEEQQRLRESLDLDDVTLKSLAVASLAFDGDLSADVEPRQEELRKMFAPLAATDFIALHDDTISIRSDPVEQVFLRYALADKQPGKGPATLETPSIMLGRRATDLIGPKLMNALKASIAAGRTRTSTEAPPEDTVPLHDDDIYTFRVEFRYGLVDSEIGHFFVANFDDRDAIDLAARAIHDEVADKMAAFGLDLKYLGTLEVDQARIQERLRRQQTSNDPAAERFNEVLSAFWTSSASGRELTRAYAVAIENGSQALPANEAAATMYSNVAFMLLGYGEIEDYWRLSERAISEGPLAISLATRALMQAKKARFDDALNTLSDALDLIADEHEIWNMYSPMFLLSDANHPLRHELIELQSGEILDVYGRVIAALGEGRSPAEALVGTEEVPTRVLLLAAVLAEVEGNDDLAAQIRGRRADTEN
jgi:tetratricopeptide (TPR) repeat protein